MEGGVHGSMREVGGKEEEKRLFSFSGSPPSAPFFLPIQAIVQST